MQVIQAVIWMAAVVVSGQPGEKFKCNMWSVRGLEQSQTVQLGERETEAQVRFTIKDDLLGDANTRFVCEKVRP